MKKTFRISAAIAASAVLIISCVRIDPTQKVIPGQPVNAITFNISTPAPNAMTSTKAMTDADETNIESLALFFFKEGNTGAANRIFVSGSDFTLGTPEVVSGTHYIYPITIGADELDSEVSREVISSGNWYIYAIANWNKSWFNVNLDALKGKSRAELDDLRIVKTSTSPNPSETALLLTGRYGEDNTGFAVLSPDSEGKVNLDGKIHLRRFVSKITVRFNSASNVNFTPERIFIHNYSRSATLFERSGWTQKNNNDSYEYGTFSGNLDRAVADSDNVIEDATNAGIGYEVLHDSNGYYYTFYMAENIPTPKPGAVINSYNDRDKCTHAGGTRSFINAPDDATYIVVTGSYEGPDIELDDDNHSATQNPASDKRTKGTVSYTIHLGNFSEGESNTAGRDDNFTIRRNAKYTYNISVNGAKNIAVEAAYNQENNSGAEGHLITTSSGTANVRLDSHYEQLIITIPGGGFDIYELLLDTPYSERQSVKSRNDNLDINWVKFAKPASTTTFRPYSEIKDDLGNIFDLIEDINDGDETDNTYYITNNGKRYTAAYIDEYYYDTIHGDVDDLSLSRFINAPDRELTFSTEIKTSNDKQSSFTITPIFSIRQRSIVSPYDVDDVTNPFGIETIEETPASSTFGGNNGTNYSHGWANFTSNITFGTSWSTYVNESVNGHDNNSDVPSSALTSEGAYGAYQCLSRNRDLNGNGAIDSEEVRWYLPATEQTNTIWYGDPFLSEEQHVDNSNKYYDSNKELYIWWALEGTAYNNHSNTARVRCVRSLGDRTQPTLTVWSPVTLDSGNTMFTVSGLNAAAGRKDRQTGEYQPHFAGDKENDKLPESFIVSKDYLKLYETITTPEYIAGNEVIASFDSNSDKWHYNIADFNDEIQRVTATMTLGATSPVQDIISFGKPDTYSKWNSNPVAHVYYPASSNAPGGMQGSGFVEICINGGHLAAAVTPGSEISVVFGGGKLVVNSGSDSSEFELPASFSQITELTVGSAEGNGRTQATGYSIVLTTTEDRASTSTEVVSATTFNRDDITGTNLCSSNYFEKADKSDLGQWRVPNEKEFSVMYSAQKDGVGTFMKASTGCRTKFERTAEKWYSGEDDLGTSMFYSLGAGTSPIITTSLRDIPSSFYVRCVRDGEETAAGTLSNGGGSYSAGGNAF